MGVKGSVNVDAASRWSMICLGRMGSHATVRPDCMFESFVATPPVNHADDPLRLHVSSLSHFNGCSEAHIVTLVPGFKITFTVITRH